MQPVNDAFAWLQEHSAAMTALQALLLVLLVALTYWLTSTLLIRIVSRTVQLTATQWDDVLLGNHVLSRVAHIAPALVLYYGVVLVSGLPAKVTAATRVLASCYLAIAIATTLSRALSALGDIYEIRDPKRALLRPIKSYLQVGQIAIYFVTTILLVAMLLNRDPLLLLSGLGALTAVLMLVFKDTLLSLVASIQLAGNDMLRVHDHIQMAELNADGDVIDITLHTVKVRNFDQTITMIPTWRLISESFINWRGVDESGGRRIKRALLLDQSSIRFLDPVDAKNLQRFALIDDYLRRKRAEIERYNADVLAGGRDPVNTRRLTNAGTFRAYVLAYLRAHEHIRQHMDLLVRQLPPGPTGLPLEIYCFTHTGLDEYEAVQADIFEHLYAILPEFGLRVFQQPSGIS